MFPRGPHEEFARPAFDVPHPRLRSEIAETDVILGEVTENRRSILGLEGL
jgi:hypothetical protein